MAGPAPASAPGRGLRARALRLMASPRFQAWAARSPFTRGRVRRDGEAMMGLVSGFVQSQVLGTLVRTGVLERLVDEKMTAARVGALLEVPAHRAEALLNAGVALGLLDRTRSRGDAAWRASVRGAALTGVPGLADMIRHHDAFYRDMADPLAIMRGARTELAEFWPYVFGARGAADPGAAARYSDLMARSQALVAQDTLAEVSLRKVRHLLDIGGGTGAFLEAAARATKAEMTLFDLPAVVSGAADRFRRARMIDRVRIVPGSFRDDPLPDGADAISLIRVLYDHEDATALALLKACRAVLPHGGRLIVSEPMTGGGAPHVAGDAYFAFYCMAMGTGRARSAREVTALLKAAGFGAISKPKGRRPFVTTVIEARA